MVRTIIQREKTGLQLDFESRDGGRALVALSDLEASALVVQLIDALRTDGRGPGETRLFYEGDDPDEIVSLCARPCAITLKGAETVLIVELEGGLRIPLSFAADELEGLADAIKAADRQRGN